MPNRLETARVTARGIARAMAAMGTEAIGVSPYDLAGGADFLQKLATEEKLPLLSANLVRTRDNQPLFSPYRIALAGRTRVAFIGLTGPLQKKSESISLRPWQEILPPLLAKIGRQSDIIILLSSMPQRINEEIATRYKTIHIIIQAGQHGGNLAPKNINNTLLCQTSGRGKYLGMLDINWNSRKEWRQSPQQNPATLQSRLDRVIWQLERFKKRYAKQGLAENPHYLRLQKEKKRLENSLAELNRDETGQGQSACTFSNLFLAMETSLPKDREIRAIVDKIRREVNRINRKIQQQQRQTNEKVLHTFSTMAGGQRCKECHPGQVAFYLRTDHARAWQTLVQHDQQYNPDCIACHVTLPDYSQVRVRDEALLTSLPARFQNVGCEACHGPSLAHANDPDKVLPSRPKAATCRQCHTAKRDPKFNFTGKKTKIQCPAG